MRYIYGPVPSRRLGLSLGVSLTPHKTCDFDCVYCQLGVTTLKSAERKEYFKVEEVVTEIAQWLANNAEKANNLSFITFAGSGEPTLHPGLGGIIVSLRKMTSVPIAVITNASLLQDPAVRREVAQADLIVPSLDAATEEVFQGVNRPLTGLRLQDILDGLAALRREYRGKIWLEVMVVKGINDDIGHARKLAELIERIRPDKIQLNSPVRYTAEAHVAAADRKQLERIQEILGDKCEII